MSVNHFILCGGNFTTKNYFKLLFLNYSTCSLMCWQLRMTSADMVSLILNYSGMKYMFRWWWFVQVRRWTGGEAVVVWWKLKSQFGAWSSVPGYGLWIFQFIRLPSQYIPWPCQAPEALAEQSGARSWRWHQAAAVHRLSSALCNGTGRNAHSFPPSQVIQYQQWGQWGGHIPLAYAEGLFAWFVYK